MGEQGFTIFETFGIQPGKIQYEELVRRFNAHFEGRENKTILRHRFLNLRQGETEGVEAFVQRVREQAKRCQLGDLEGDLANHVIINGLNEDSLRTDLLKIPNITVENVNTECSRFASADRTIGELKGLKIVEEVGAAGMSGDRQRDRGSRIQDLRCRGCGGRGHLENRCPKTECFNCLGRGHMSYDCRRRAKGRKCMEEGHSAQSCNKRSRMGERRDKTVKTAIERDESL
jgi:hypothetical protein